MVKRENRRHRRWRRTARRQQRHNRTLNQASIRRGRGLLTGNLSGLASGNVNPNDPLASDNHEKAVLDMLYWTKSPEEIFQEFMPSMCK